MKHIWLIDSGHGGMIDGRYVTAPKKQFEHKVGNWFYEGVFNREIKHQLIDKMMANDLTHIDICPTELDVDLDVRVDIANAYYKEYYNAVLISLHSNAGGGTGFEIWTSVGQTRSDDFAEILGNEIKTTFTDFAFRPDTQDGDLDKESHFYILKYTKCPAVLPECLFFDNFSDYKILIDRDFQNDYVDALIRFMQSAEAMNI
jgi:N-acetylmuramoyl-L-alanine amidase